MIPSIKTLMTLQKSNRTPITRDEAKEIRAACERRRGLAVADRILGGYGQESIGLPDGCFNNCQDPEVSIWYVNMGDTYSRTLLKVNGSYRIGDWGSVVERYEGAC